VGKKVYKKNKKVKEIIIYKRAQYRAKLNRSAFVLLGMVFLFFSLFYYLNNFFITDNSSFFTIKYIDERLNNVLAVKKQSSHFIPFTPNWKEKLLQQKKTKLASKNTSKPIANQEITMTDDIIWHGPRDKKEVALTFDADMTPVMVDWLRSGQASTYDDSRITDYLEQHQIKATFFLTGLWIQSYPQATKELADNSLFELENHTYSHPSMNGYCFDQPQVPESQYPYEIEKTQQLIEQYTHQAPKYFRFPGGCYDQNDLDLVKKEGLVTVHWDDVANDGFNSDEEQVINNVLSEAQNGSIIVMHMGGQANVPVTADALPTIVDELQKRGYTFVTVSELLNPPVIATKLDPKKYLSSLETFTNLTP